MTTLWQEAFDVIDKIMVDRNIADEDKLQAMREIRDYVLEKVELFED